MYIGLRLVCEDSFAINLPLALLLEYCEAKIQMLSVLSWRLACERRRISVRVRSQATWRPALKVRQNSNFLIFKSAVLDGKATDEL